MPAFRHGAIEIAFLDEGEGEPIVLVHGFGSNKEVNWVRPGWTTTLTTAGRSTTVAMASPPSCMSRRIITPT